ncbi:hypothetical protein BS47DRAFT_1373229 [Hydnum rufescens UP504]|uniref:RFX-type winged-helix domain-containing protein n=1 Tax=Hydnum rufescens UP504 TaxID=1448309 RepID=A0A9P6ARV2_9AGAM|nr:hypothetical protein BS47DRAFT_1373229 [Hydnum rufescens UP504]
MSLQGVDLDHYSTMHSRSQSASPSSASSVRSSAFSHRPPSSHHPTVSEDLYRSSFTVTKTSDNAHHSRSASNGSSQSNYSLAATHLTTPNDSPPMEYNHSGMLKSPPVRQTAIRRARQESSNPYTRSNSFSGSESVRSSSSEAEDNGVFAFNPQQQQQQPQGDYSNIFVRQPTANSLGTATGAFQRMTLNSEHQLEQLANNVRAATTTSASDRAKHIFVQAWLNSNYAPYPDGNVPRQGLYNSYRRVCDEYRIPHVNTATLGKAIRLCFPAIKTRRLGVRGNSKYHYCGIRPATAAEAEWLQDFIKRTNNHRAAANSRPASQSGRSSATDDSPEDEEDDGDEIQPNGARNHLSINGGGRKSPVLFSIDDKTPTVGGNLSAAQGSLPHHATGFRNEAQIRRRSPPSAQQNVVVSSNVPSHMRNALNGNGNGPLQQRQSQSVRSLHNFPTIEEALGTSSQSSHGVVAREVWRWFEEHLDSLTRESFWSGLSGEHREVVHAPAVAGLMARADAVVYDEILEILRSQMLTSIPPHTLSSLRQLADKMEKVLLLALENYGNTFVEPKVELGARFGHLVLRFLDIFQVTQALTSVMSNPKQLIDMSRSWREVDFESVRNQAALVCNCRHEDLHQLLEVDFVNVLDGLQASLEPVRDIMVWADTCCERLMGTQGGALGQEERATMSSRSLLIRWGYVTSQIMRDLTIRSDPAFGAFQILKLFIDDWIALNVLRSVALSTNSVAASVEPVIQQQFLALSPGTSQFASSNLDPSHVSHQQQAHHHSLDHTSAGILSSSAMHDPFASTSSSSHQHSQLVDGSSHFPYDPLSFGPMESTTGGASPGLMGPSTGFGGQSFDFSQNIGLDVSSSPSQQVQSSSGVIASADAEMSSGDAASDENSHHQIKAET